MTKINGMLQEVLDNKIMLVIAGPCLAESFDLCDRIASQLISICYGRAHLVFKASADKANRSSSTSPRGPGFIQGLRILEQIKEKHGIPITTDVHYPTQVAMASVNVDLLQTPALLMRQTDLMMACGQTRRNVNLKKGQFSNLPTALRAFEKIKRKQFQGTINCITERGTTFGGEGDLVVDFRNFLRIADHDRKLVRIIDATHSIQRQSDNDLETSTGEPEFSMRIAMAGLAAGAHGIFVECHPEPEDALSDGSIATPLEHMKEFIHRCLSIWEASK